MDQKKLAGDTDPVITQNLAIHFAEAKKIIKFLKNESFNMLSKRGSITADSLNNTVWIKDTPQHINTIKQIVKAIDKPIKQILIEARITSVDSDFEREIGISFSSKSDNSSEMQNDFPSYNGISHAGLAVFKLANGTLLDMELSALESEGKGNIISSPSLYTTNQQTATIEAGEEIPYQEVSKSGATSVTFKKAVLSLEVTPQILPDKKILLTIQVNQDKPNNRQVLGVPTISTRKITTHVLVNNGETIVLGGIYEQTKDKGTRRVPFLGSIPLLGYLFRYQKDMISKRELLIFVTPKIT